MWSEQPLENLLRDRLGTLPEPDKTTLLTDYLEARRFVIEEIAGLIPAAEPNLTDHSENHLADVMKRARALIGEDVCYFDPLELYLLCISILFHDVGNLHGRGNHQNKIADIYNACRHQDHRFNTERTAVLSIAGAHTGFTRDGSKDTLREVYSFSFRAETIRGQQVAAVLRLADELAEGPHRTSGYLLNSGGYAPASQIFHRYAPQLTIVLRATESHSLTTSTWNAARQGWRWVVRSCSATFSHSVMNGSRKLMRRGGTANTIAIFYHASKRLEHGSDSGSMAIR